MSNSKSVVRWGVMSTARIATKVGAAIHAAENSELTAVASRSADKAAAWATEHRALRSYGSYQELLDDPEIDAIYIPLPPSMHAEWTIKAAESGKHVLCEKPLAMNASECWAMFSACLENNVQLMDGVMWVHHPRADEMKHFILDGTLGTLRHVTSAFTFNWDEIPEGDLRLQRELGGGSLLDLGWYCVRATLWAYDALPFQVYGTARNYNDVDMHFTGILWFDDERMATINCGFDTGMRKWFEVAGDKASLVCDDFTKPWDEEKPRFWLHDGSGKMSEEVSSPLIQEVCMIEDFNEIVRSGERDDSWPLHAILTQRVCDALDESARTGKVIELD